MFGISITDGLYPFLDKAILGTMLPLEAVGIYRVADSVASLNSAFVSPFVAFWPYISKLYKENRMDELCEAYRSINLVIIVLLIPFCLVLMQLSGWILSLFGPLFAIHGRTVLLILSFGCVVDAIAGPAGAVLKMTKHSRLSLGINSVLLVIYFAISVALTKAYGVVGIATARAAVMALGNIASLRQLPAAWVYFRIAGSMLAPDLGCLDLCNVAHDSSELLRLWIPFSDCILRTLAVRLRSGDCAQIAHPPDD